MVSIYSGGPGHPIESYRKARWSAWVSQQLERSNLSRHGLAALISDRRSSIKGTANLVQDWLLKKRMARAATAFKVGQRLGTLQPTDINGITALYAAGYLVQTIQVVAQLARDAVGCHVAAAFFTSLPTIHANLDQVETEQSVVEAWQRSLVVYLDSAYGSSVGSTINDAWKRALKYESAWQMEDAASAILNAALAIARSDVANLPVVWSMMIHSALTHFVARVDNELWGYLDSYCEAVKRTLPFRPVGEYFKGSVGSHDAFLPFVPMLDGKTLRYLKDR